MKNVKEDKCPQNNETRKPKVHPVIRIEPAWNTQLSYLVAGMQTTGRS